MSVAPALSTEPVYDKVQQTTTTTVEPSLLGEVYCVDQIADFILSNNYKSPCLQFPDDLVRDSAQVASMIQHKTGGITCYVLADTSYSPCCVDEIAAQHVRGDIIFHFGSACLNPSKSLPVVYVSRREVNANEQKIKDVLGQEHEGKTILYPDTKYIGLAYKLANELDNDKLVLAQPPANYSFIPRTLTANTEWTDTCAEIPNRVLSQPLSDDDKSSARFVYLTDVASESLALQWSTAFGEILAINGQGQQLNVHPALRRRYRSVQQIKAAGTIGILVNTLSLKETAALLERTKKAITEAGKKYYMFVVGKPNVAKLGNFEAIDVWVILGCPQGGIILDNDEYFKPIVTPYELELAFNDAWTGKWLTQFDQVLKEYDSSQPESSSTDENKESETGNRKGDNGEEEEPLFDLVTGRFVFNNAPLRQVQHLDLETGGELQKSSNALTIRNTVSTAAEHLQKRTWRGLGSDHAEITEEYAELKKGRSGIARNYNEQV